MAAALLALLAAAGALMGWLAAGLVVSSRRSEIAELGILLRESFDELQAASVAGGERRDAALARAHHALKTVKDSGLVD